jgi:hypothetical protein
MKYIPFLLVTVIAFSSCSVYKNSQTPDDVYYSPGTEKEGYAAASNNNDEYYSTTNDQYVRMRVKDPDRWSYFDDYNTDYYGGYGMGYSPYGSFGYSSFGYGISPWIGFGYWSPFSYWNSYYTWNSFYNPYYGGIVIVNPKIPSSNTYTRLRTFNPASYTNSSSNYNRNSAGRSTRSSSFSPYNYSQTIRSNYNNTNSSNRSYRPVYNRPSGDYNQPTRSYTPSFNSGSSGGGGGVRSGGGGGGGVSRPGR